MYTASTFAGVIDNVLVQLRPIAGLLVGLALAYFLWGLAQFILNSSDAAKREDGKKTMLWGIIALFVMVSMWGLAGVISGSLQLDNTKPPVDYVKP